MSALSNGCVSLGKLGSSESNVPVPAFIYGSAWKEKRTAHLVSQALQAGFTALDTAAQPRHYREDLVGEAVRQVLSPGTLQRGNLFVNITASTVAFALRETESCLVTDEVHAHRWTGSGRSTVSV